MSVSLISLEDPADQAVPLAPWMSPRSMGLVYGGCEILTARCSDPPPKGATMCRWLAYTGSPILLTQALYTPAHSLIDQSLHSRLGAETTNGDGFGVGWYDAAPVPGVFRSIEPAWNDQNLRELAGHISPAVLRPHPRGDRVGGAADQLPSVPPRPLAVHAQRVHRRLRGGQARPGAGDRRVAVPGDPGTADTEVLFYLALSFGLEDDPPDAVARAIGLVEACGRPQGVVPVPGHDRHHRRGEPVGVPLLQRGQVPVAVLHPRVRTLREHIPSGRCCERCPMTRGWWSPSRSATARRLERDARVKLRGGQQGRRPAPALFWFPRPRPRPGNDRTRTTMLTVWVHHMLAVRHPEGRHLSAPGLPRAGHRLLPDGMGDAALAALGP